MRMKPCPVVAFEIPAAGALDAITVFFQDFVPGKGRVLIECYGSAWTAYFGSMDGRTIRQFFVECGADYLVSKLGITPELKQSKRAHAYLRRIIKTVQEALMQPRAASPADDCAHVPQYDAPLGNTYCGTCGLWLHAGPVEVTNAD